MYKLAIFDLDGTLLNTLHDLAQSCNYALRTLGLEEHPVNQYKRYVGNGVYKLMERMLPDGRQDDEMIQKAKELFDAYYVNHSMDYTRPYDGIMPLLTELRDKGIRLAVASNKPDAYTKELVQILFKEKIEVAFGQREGIPAKPDPEVVWEILSYFNMSPSECIYIGDSDVDIFTAKNAGITSVGAAWGFRTKQELLDAGANYIILNPDELKQLILGE